MRPHVWVEARDGVTTEESTRERLTRLGFAVETVRYPAGTWVPRHTHETETIDAVVSGVLEVCCGDGLPIKLAAGQAVELAAGEAHDVEARSGEVLTVHGVRKPPPVQLWRYLTLATLVAAANVWAWIQFGAALDQLVAVNALLASLPAVVGKAGAGAQGAYDALWRTWLGRLASNRGLWALGLLFVLVTGFFSSVVYHSTADEPVRAALVAKQADPPDETEQTWAEPGAATRFFRFTHPFGRELELQVEGFRPQPVRVMPWWPAQRVSADLDPIIALMIRLDPQLPGNGFLEITAPPQAWVTPRESPIAGCPPTARCFPIDRHWAFFLTPETAQVPASLIDNWTGELGEGEREQLVLASWIHPAPAPQRLNLRGEETLTLRFFTQARICQGSLIYEVGDGRLQQRLLPKNDCP